MPVLREMIRLLVLGFAEGASKMRRLVRAHGRPERAAQQSESVKGEPRFRRRPRRRLLSARHLAGALGLPALVPADMCDGAVGIEDANRV